VEHNVLREPGDAPSASGEVGLAVEVAQGTRHARSSAVRTGDVTAAALTRHRSADGTFSTRTTRPGGARRRTGTTTSAGAASGAQDAPRSSAAD